MYTDSEHSDDADSSDDDVKEDSLATTFNLFEYISQSPTVTGVAINDFSEKKYKEILYDAYLAHKNKLENILEVLFTMNSNQRSLIISTWTSRRDGGGTDLRSVLKDFFNDLKNEELSLKLLLLMLKNLDELDAEWIHDALYDLNENNKIENDELIIEIICTRTYKQLRELTISYKNKYNKELLRDIKLKYRKIDINFIKMAENLLNGERDENVLNKPKIEELTADVELFQNALKKNKIPTTVLNKLCITLTTRSWRHIHDLCPVYAQLIGYNLQTSLQHKLMGQNQLLPSNLAMINIVEISRSIHLYFANRLSLILKSNNKSLIHKLHRIILSRCEIDLGAISNLFASKEDLCDNKTLKQWITEKINSKKQAIHQKILLFLCGLSESIEYDDNNDDNKDTVYYVANYDEHVGSVTGVDSKQFNPELDVQSIMNWIHPIQDGEATKDERKKLKDKMAKLLCNRNSMQRDKISKLFRLKHKSDIIDYLQLILKKGSSLKICNYLLQTITGCYIIKLKHCIDNKDLNGICDILCCHDPPQLTEFIKIYTKKYDSDLIQEIQETCNRLKKTTLWRIFSKLLSNKKCKQYSVNIRSLKKDIKFLTNFKKSKFKNLKDDLKREFVDIFCINNKLYIRALNLQFQQISHDYNLIYLIDKVLGIKSGSGYAIKIILQYSLNQSEYFAKKIYYLGSKNWKKYEEEISFIFISRSEIDLYSIQLAFHNNLYADGKIMSQWVAEKTNESKTGLFLVLLLQALSKNKTSEQQTRETLRAISIPTFSGIYSNIYTPKNNIKEPGFFDNNNFGTKSLTLGHGQNHLQFLSESKTQQIKENNIDSPIAIIDKVLDSDKNNRKKSQSKSTSKSVSKSVSKKVKTTITITKSAEIKEEKEEKEKEKEKEKEYGSIAKKSKNIKNIKNIKMKKLSESARQEMAKKIINTLTKKVKLSEIDVKNKNNKIEPDELFDFLKRKKLTVPRYISNVVFNDIDINKDGHITMYEYFKWKSKISVIKMFNILPEEIPDIDDDDAVIFEEGIPFNKMDDINIENEEEIIRETTTTTTTTTMIAKEDVIENEEDEELKILEAKLNLYKKLLNLTIKNKNDEALNKNIFQAYCNRNNFGLNRDQIYRIFDDMDYNGDGRISPMEYFKWRDLISIGYLNDLLLDNNNNNNKKKETIFIPKMIEEKEEKKEEEKDKEIIINKDELKDIESSPYSKSDYINLEIQITILVDDNRKNWSLYLLDSNNEFNEKLSFLDFVNQHLTEKIVNQLFKKFGKNDIVESHQFAELLTFTYTLYRAKLQREHFKTDNRFKKMKNNQVRPKIEHFVIWVIRTFGKELKDKNHTVSINNPNDKNADKIDIGEYNEYRFILNKNSYSIDLAKWIKKYIKCIAQHQDIETAWMILMIWLE